MFFDFGQVLAVIIIVNVHNNRAKYNITPNWTRLKGLAQV